MSYTQPMAPTNGPRVHRRRQRFGGDRPARPSRTRRVGDHRAVRRIELGLRVRRRLGQAAQQRTRDLGNQPDCPDRRRAPRFRPSAPAKIRACSRKADTSASSRPFWYWSRYSNAATSRTSGSALTSRMRRSSGDTQRERNRFGCEAVGGASAVRVAAVGHGTDHAPCSDSRCRRASRSG